IKAAGKHFQGCICYTLTEPRLGGEVYNIDYYVKKAKDLESMGADTICIKDMAGLIAPYDAFELVAALKKAVKPPIHLHSHFTSGMSALSMLKAVEAGVDIIDTVMAPYAYRTAHAAIEPLVMALLGTNRDTGFDIKLLAKINDVLEKEVMPKYKHLLDDTKMSIIDINVLLHQTPGGMLSNLVNQLKEMDAVERIDDVFAELPRVRKDLGQIPLVTPTSQIVGVQTVMNVLFDTKDERYKRITDQVKDLCYGLYGKTAVPINADVQKKALKGYARGEKPITARAASVLDPELEKAKEATKGLAKDIDDVLIYALYPVTGLKFLKWKYGKEAPPADTKARTMEEVRAADDLVRKAKAGLLVEKPQKKAPAPSDQLRKFNVFVDGEYFEVGVDAVGGTPLVNYARPIAAAVAMPAPAPVAAPATAPAPAAAPEAPKAEAPNAPADTKGSPLLAPMPGMIVKYLKNVGDSVKEGETLLVLEAMKMENALPAPASGTVKALGFSSGDSVKKGDVLAVVG
ncbi:MAG: pyruvate carboxylase subunit B, partial [Methylococcus sp.]